MDVIQLENGAFYWIKIEGQWIPARFDAFSDSSGGDWSLPGSETIVRSPAGCPGECLEHPARPSDLCIELVGPRLVPP